jgi:MFS family permease
MVGDRLGRKNCIYVGALLQAIGAILQASSFGVPHMIVGRIVWQVAPSINVGMFLTCLHPVAGEMGSTLQLHPYGYQNWSHPRQEVGTSLSKAT